MSKACIIEMFFVWIPSVYQISLVWVVKVQAAIIKWKHFPCYCPFVRLIHRSPVNSPHKGQWRGALIFSLICAWINGWVKNREAGDLKRHSTHYDVIEMKCFFVWIPRSELSMCLGVMPDQHLPRSDIRQSSPNEDLQRIPWNMLLRYSEHVQTHNVYIDVL